MKSEVDFEENEDGIRQRNMLNCFSCKFETENIDELDEHILVNHDDDDDEIPEQKFQIVKEEPSENNRKRKKSGFSDLSESFFKSIPRARIIVKKHDPKFQICNDTKLVKKDDSKFCIGGGPTKRAKRSAAEEMHCHLCPFMTRKKSVLATHMLNHSDVIPPVYYKCSQCPYQTKRKNDMPKHMLGHCSNDNVPLYKCRECSYVTKRKGDLPKHEMNHAERSQVFSWNCSECEYFSKRKNDLHKHMLIHSDRQLTGVFKCLKCAYATDKVVRFSRHVLSKCVCWDDPISLEHLMLEDILASTDKTGVHLLLGEESDDEPQYVEDVQYVQGNGEADVEYVEYVDNGEGVDENSTIIVEGEIVDQQFVEADANVDAPEESHDDVQQQEEQPEYTDANS